MTFLSLPFARLRLAALALAAMLAGLANAPAFAQANIGAMVVLDTSAGMGNKLGTRVKLDIARATISTALANPPANLSLGMVAYGHRQKTSCSDVEVLVAPAPGNSTPIKTAAAALKPTGKAPLASAVKLAAETLDYQNAKATIVVVTSGIDDCASRICDIASDLHDSAADLTIHVIGLGLTDAQRATVACFASLNNGLYIDASNADQLAAALNKAVIVETVAPLPVASVKGPETVTQKTTFEIAFSGPFEKGDQVQIAWPSSRGGDYITSVVAKRDRQTGHLTAPAEIGTYEIRYWLPSRGRVIARQTITVVKAAERLSAPPKIGQGTLFEARWEGKIGKGDLIEVVRRGTTTPVLASSRMREDNGRARLDAPAEPGLYDVRYHPARGNGAIAVPVEVVPVQVALSLPSGVVGGTDFKVRWKGPGAPTDEVQLAAAGMKDGESLQGYRVDNPDRPVTLAAPAAGGSFEVRYWSTKFGKVLARAPLTIGGTVAATLDAPAEATGGGKLAIAWKGPAARGDEIHIARTDMAPGERLTSADLPLDGGAASIAVPNAAGSYVLRYWSSHTHAVLATRPLTVKATPTTLEVAGAIKAGRPFNVAWKGPGERFDELRVGTADGDPRDALHFSLVGTAGQPVAVRAPARPGSYVLRYWSAATNTVLASRTITVE
ncbi:MAG: VWA domain-containing protein [Bauldia sp.]